MSLHCKPDPVPSFQEIINGITRTIFDMYELYTTDDLRRKYLPLNETYNNPLHGFARISFSTVIQTFIAFVLFCCIYDFVQYKGAGYIVEKLSLDKNLKQKIVENLFSTLVRIFTVFWGYKLTIHRWNDGCNLFNNPSNLWKGELQKNLSDWTRF